MIDLSTHIYNYNNWKRQIVTLITDTETLLNERNEITNDELQRLTGRIKNIASFISKMETVHIPALAQSLQLLAMNGHFTQDDANTFILYSHTPDTPPSALRERVLTNGASEEVIDIPNMKHRLRRLMRQIENKPVSVRSLRTYFRRLCLIS